MFTDKSLHNLTLENASERVILSDVTYVRNFSENEYFLMYIKRGKAKLILEKTLYTVSSGYFVLCNNTDLKYRFSKRHQSSVFTLSFSGFSAFFRCGVYKCADCSSVEKLLGFITSEFILNKKYNGHLLSSLTESLFVILSRAIEKETDVDKTVNELMLDIHRNYRSRKIDISNYAETLGLSKDRLASIFKSRFGYPPYQYQIMLKLNDATDLLLHTDLPICEIAELSGYKNQLYFSTAYKKHVGTAPTDMRKKNRKQS